MHYRYCLAKRKELINQKDGGMTEKWGKKSLGLTHSKNIYSYAECTIFIHYIYDTFQECASIKRQASTNNSWQSPHFLLD